MSKAKNLFPSWPFFVIIIVTFFLLAPSANSADTLRVSVDKTNVNLDWSAMPAAPSYTLYYALADWRGEIDANTIGSIEMGATRSLSAGLPSGLILYVAILAHAGGGDVISNIVQFMPFAGTVSFPETGSELIAATDPGGIGNYTVYGTRDAVGAPSHISQINYSISGYSLVLKVSADRPEEITEGNVTTKIIYQAGGSVTFQKMQPGLSSLQVNQAGLLAASAAGNDSDLCTSYASRDDYELYLRKDSGIDSEVERRTTELNYPKIAYGMYFVGKYPAELFNYKTMQLSVLTPLFALSPSGQTRTKLLQSMKAIAGYLDLLRAAVEGIEDQVIDEKLASYDQQCNGQTQAINPPGNQHLTIDFNCPIPDLAGVTSHDQLVNGVKFEYYMLNGKTVGPYMTLYQQPDGSFEYNEIRCYNLEGEQNGWDLKYRKTDGQLYYATQYVNGVKEGKEYAFYPRGSWSEYTYSNGSKIDNVYHPAP